MARKKIVRLIDDLDGKEIAEGGQTLAFSFNGTDYEIDLGPKNAKKLTDALAPFVAAARRTGGRRSGSGRPSKVDQADLSAIRAWGKEHGYKVSDRGRVSQEVQEAYRAS
jgi:hypothetical protein